MTACGRIDNFEALKRYSFGCPAPSESQVHPIARSKLSCRLHRQGDSNRGPLQSALRTHFGKANRHHAQTNTQRRPGSPHSKKQTLLPVTPSRRLEPRFTPKCSSHPFWEGSGPSCPKPTPSDGQVHPILGVPNKTHPPIQHSDGPKPAPSEGQVHPIARSKLSCRLHRQETRTAVHSKVLLAPILGRLRSIMPQTDPSDGQVHPILGGPQQDPSPNPTQRRPQTSTQRRPGSPHSKKQTLLPLTPSRQLEPRSNAASEAVM